MIEVFIEAEAGSRNKQRYDEQTLVYQRTDRVLHPYPYPYGFVLGTRGEDGQCADSYVITRTHLKAGTSVSCEPFGLLEMQEDDEVDHKILAALPGERVEASEALREELCDFIVAIFARFPEVRVRVGRILPRKAALAHLERCRAAGTAS